MRKLLFILIVVVSVIFLGGCAARVAYDESTTEEESVSAVYKLEPITEDELTTLIEESTTEYISEEPEPEEIEYEESVEEEEPEPEEIEYEEDDGHGSYIGHFELTAYEWTGDPMANGEYPYYGACACNSLPLGTEIYIAGYGTFVVKDRGGMGNNVIDIYLGDPDECWEFGRQEADVYYAD